MAAVSAPVPVGRLLFGDEFEGPAGSKPDPRKWVGKTRGLASGIHLDGLTNIQLDGQGNVVITAHKQSDGWHSGFLSAVPIGGYSGKRYIEAKVKVGQGLGVWNGAVWEWAAPYGAGGLEVDVCEQLGREPNVYHATVHDWADTGEQKMNTIRAAGPLGDGFHVYGAAIYPDRIDWYLDGVHVRNLKGNPATALASAVNVKDFTTFKVVPNLSLNMGGWGGTIQVPGPVHLTADYIRVHSLA